MNACIGCGKRVGTEQEARENKDGSGPICPMNGSCNIVDFEGVNRLRAAFLEDVKNLPVLFRRPT